MRVATVTCGYADGYHRCAGPKAEVLIHGKRAPVVGNICMDMCMVDVTDFEEKPKVGDEVVLFGSQKSRGRHSEISVDEISDMLDTINYEVTCLVGKRIPRVYIKDGRIVQMHSSIW